MCWQNIQTHLALNYICICLPLGLEVKEAYLNICKMSHYSLLKTEQ